MDSRSALRDLRSPFRALHSAMLAALWLLSSLTLLAAPPAITTQPQKRTVVAGANYTFNVSATGTGPLFHQWRRNGSVLPNQTNSSLALTAIQTNDAGGYSVVVTNTEGATTSIVAQLTVRLASDPAYPTPHGGWAYIFQGTGISDSQTAALDGTWNKDPASDSWDGLGRGAGTGAAGGINTTNGVLTIEDVVTSGTGFNNRRFYFTHDLTQETTVTNANTVLNDGVTLTFRARLTPASDPLIELTNAPNGLANYVDGKGMFGIRQSGGSGLLIGFSLNQAIEDLTTSTTFNFGQSGLHMNNLNGNTRSAAVDPGEGGTINLLGLDPTLFHEFWITIQDNGADPGTHRVSIYLDGSKTPTTFNATAGSGYDVPATNYLALGMGNSAQRGGVDVDFFGYQAGVVLPSAFNEPVGIVTQPASQFVAEGQIANFNVGVTGTPPYSFQWYRNGTAISGATNSNHSTAPVTSGDAGAQFIVVVANECNTVTSTPPAVLQLLGAPNIITQPASLTVTNGDAANFSVVVSSPVTPTYQWRFNGVNLSGETSATLSIPGTSAASAGGYDVIVANGSGSVTSALAVLTIVLFDYGDAPDPTFPTLRANSGAGHRFTPGIHLGSAIDAEADGQPNAGATGDDTSGSDDEDGVIFSPLLAGQSAIVQVVASTNGVLNAWLDFDRNGSWTGVGEQIFTNAPLVAGTNMLSLLVPANASPGITHARVRFDTSGGLSFAGLAANGEVEDYAPILLPVADLSVAQTATPDPVAVNANLTCAIIVSNAGPSTAASVVTTNVLPPGVNFVSVVSSQGSCLLLAGELTCDLGALNNGASATITLLLKATTAGPLTNIVRVAGSAADLASANNTATVAINALEAPAISAQPQNLTVTNGSPATLTVTATGAAPLRYQWRLNGADVNNATNSVLTIVNAQPADAGAYTVRITNLVGTVTSLTATLTVLVPPAITTQPQSRTNLAGSSASFTATGTGTAPLTYQWTLNNANLAGETSPTLSLPSVHPTNAGAYRLVLSNSAGAITSAVATLTVIALDLGDAPDTYRTVLTNNGARHRVVAGIRLGTTVDFEVDGQPDATATGDDAGSPDFGPDDEDGVTFTTPIRAGQNVTLTVVASTNGVLNGWLDYNRNGSWAEAGEQCLTNRNLPIGTSTVTFVAPSGASAGPSYARFRFSTTANLTFDGPPGSLDSAPVGEVEDYAVNIEGVSDLRIVRYSQTNFIATGSNQFYSITVSNAGPSAATGVALTDTLPAEMIFVSAQTTLGACTHSAGVVNCALGGLATGGSATIDIRTLAMTAGTVLNTVTVGGNQVDLVPANNTVAASTFILNPPAIITHPQDQIVTNGGIATLNATASGSLLRYQWLLNSAPVTGGTNSTLTIANTQPANAGSYTLRVTNEIGAAVSTPAMLTVLAPVTITTQPQSQTVLVGATVTFNVAASGTPPITYQWEHEGLDLVGATDSTLVLPGVQTNQAGGYRVRVTNPIGTVNSALASLTLLDPPQFILQPESVTNLAGSTVTLTATAVGASPLTYQWYFNQTTLLAGQTNSSVTFTNVQTIRTGAYTVLASNTVGVRTSAVATLTIYEVDFGDAPEALGYPTTLAFNGARHRLLPGVRLGALADFETNGAPNTTANGDDLTGLDDEDGVLLPASLLVGQTALIPVIASTNGLFDAWIDFNGNGSWGDAGEQILANHPLLAGTNTVAFAIAPSALPGARYVRCRFSTAGGLPSDGFALDGEVEDYRVNLQPAVDLAIGLVELADPVQVSSNLTYVMSVTNRGPATATTVNVTNLLHPSMTYIQATPSQGFCTDIGSNAWCPIDNIPPGGVVTITLQVRATLPGTFVNTAIVRATEPDLNPADNTITQTTAVILPPTRYTNAAALPVADATASGPGRANPYPSTILVSGLTSALYKVTVTLNALSHPFSKDFDILLVGPQGQRVLLMSDAGAGSLGGVTLTFDDNSDLDLPSTGVIGTGTYRPSNYGTALDVFPTPAPAGPYGQALSVFKGTNPNGLWSLYVVDGQVAGNGSIGGGWQMTLTTTDPIADLTIGGSVNGIAHSSLPLTDPLKVAVNSNLFYALTVTNRGPAVADAAVLTNALPPGVTLLSAVPTLGSCTPLGNLVICNFGNLASGSGASVTLTVRPTVAGVLTNTTEVTANRLDPAPTNNRTTTIVAARPVTDLAVAQTASTNLLLLGQQLTYTLNVTNRGPNPATSIRLVDELPANLNFLAATSTQGACSNAPGSDGSIVTCQLGTLASGASAQVTVSVGPLALGTATNRVQVASDEVDMVATNNAASTITLINVAADLSLALTDGPDPVAVGSPLQYEIIVTNRGPGFAYEIQLTNTLPPNVTFLNAVAPDGACVHTPGPGGAGGTVHCTLGILTTGSSTPVTITVAPATTGRHTNNTHVTAQSIDPVPANNQATAITDSALPPVILAAPQNLVITNGGTAQFTASAGGTAPLTYQWQFNNADLPGATNTTLTITNAPFTSQGNYRLRVSNPVATIFSQVATLRVLVRPTISNLGDLQTDEDLPTAIVQFTVTDVDAPTSALSLTATCAEPGTGLPSLLATNFIFGGGSSNRTLQIQPTANRYGTGLITIVARDAEGLTASDTLLLTVRPVNDAPTLTDLLNRTMLEDAALAIPFIISDAETPPEMLGVSVISSNTVLFPATNVVPSGTHTNRLLILQPAANQTGIGTFRVTITDTNGVSTSDEFQVTVAAVNDPPTLNQPAHLTLNEDAGPQTVILSGITSGAANETQTLTVTAVSTNPSLFATPVVSYTNGQSSGTLTFTPLTNAHGSNLIAVTVEDGGTSNNVVVRQFTVIVNPGNDLPRVLDLVAVTTPEDTPTGLIAFRVDDVETAAGGLQLSATASAAGGQPLSGFSFQFSSLPDGTNRTLRVLPATNWFGLATITVTATDGDGGSGSAAFTSTVMPVNDAPVMEPLADLAIDEDSMATVPVTVGDVETPAQAITVVVSSSNTNLLLATVANGVGSSNRVVTLRPTTNATGSATITVTVTDTNAVSVSDEFQVTVRPVNDPPVVEPLADLEMEEDSVATVPVTVGDAETTAGDITVTVSSLNTNLVVATVAPGVGSSNRLVTLRPTTNAFGSATIIVTVTDANAVSVSDEFQVTVRPVNDLPVVEPLADLEMEEDSVATVPVTVGDVETPAAAITVAVRSSNTNLVVATAANGIGSSNRVLTLRPSTNATGSATITVTVTDTNAASVSDEFQVTVRSVNDLPEVSAIAPQTIDENSSTPLIHFTVRDVETPAEALNVVADSSNTNLVPVGNVMLSLTGTNRTLVVTPVTNRFGVTVITLTVTDTNGGSVTTGFELTVRQVIQPPVLMSQPQGLTVTNGGPASFSVTVTGTPPISFQWRRNGTDVAGGTNATLSLTSVQASDAGSYTVMASNPAGQVTSEPAVLRVLVSPTITAIQLAGVSAEISFSTEAGLSYTVEFKNTPDAPAWTPLAPMVGTGGVVVVTDAAATAPSRLYRVRVE